MLIFDKSYREFVIDYIVPLSTYSVKFRSIKKNNIKSVLCAGQNTGVSIENEKVKFLFSEDIIMPALLGDIWLCYIRSIMQWNSTMKIYPLEPDFCPNWSIVSDYYCAFYDASTLLRLYRQGNIFLDQDSTKEISQIVSEVSGEMIRLSSNSVYSIYKDAESANSIFSLELNPSKKQTHETVWIEVANLIRKMERSASKKSAEYVVLNSLSKILTILGDTFPSKIRNAVNYQLPYGVKAIEKKIHPANVYNESEKWLDPILNFSGRVNEEQQLLLFKGYAYYLHIFVSNLIAEYVDLRGRQCGIQSAINRNRTDPIEFPKKVFLYS